VHPVKLDQLLHSRHVAAIVVYFEETARCTESDIASIDVWSCASV
jgi:hypothetical protein